MPAPSLLQSLLLLLCCPSPPPQVKMAVSRKLCGAVIGQKGQTIRDFMLDSGATIRVQVRCVLSCEGGRLGTGWSVGLTGTCGR